MRLYFLLLCLVLYVDLSAQRRPEPERMVKRPIDTIVLSEWSRASTGGLALSPFGRYVGYFIEKGPLFRGTRTLVIQDSSGSWERTYTGVTTWSFSSDEKQAIFQKGDSLHFLQLGSGGVERVIGVRSFSLPSAGRGEWLAYEEKAMPGALILVNLLSGSEQSLGSVSEYFFSEGGESLLFAKGDSSGIELHCLELASGKMRSIWMGRSNDQVGDFRFDRGARQMVFIVTESTWNQDVHSIWYYRFGEEKAECRLRDGDIRIDAGFLLDGAAEFSGNGRWLFFTVRRSSPPPVLPKPDPAAIQVDVWSYKDRYLQPDQLTKQRNRVKIYTAVIGVTGEGFRVLEQENQHLDIPPLSQLPENTVVIRQSDSDARPHLGPMERFSYPLCYYVLSLKDGTRKLFKKDATYLPDLCFSPGGRWLVYYDEGKENYYSYDLVSGQSRNITRGLPSKVSVDYSRDIRHPQVEEVAGWLKGDSAVLIYDNYDLWAVDPAGRRPAVNVTGGYGMRHHVKLRLTEHGNGRGDVFVWSKGDTLLLTGFNMDNKYNGFFRQIMGERGGPQMLLMGPYTFYRTPSQKDNNYSFDDGMVPHKASKADCWVVRRQSAREAPNYFITTDFRTYRPLSHLAPQAAYNWLTTELITWRQLDGTSSQGILYKPENFDPTRKYPVIFNYYELVSHTLYEFPEPGLTTGDINIPWFVSRGYLVFTPDIHYKIASESGKTAGQWAYNAVVSAAHYLAKLPYVDARRMAIQGHSFGGGETNYLVTHTHLFAAAAEAAGVSDPISAYLTLLQGPGTVENEGNQYYFEQFQGRYGATPWQRPELYREGSAVLHADQVTTPLLIMHNKKDGAVQWRQGVELYMALRRLKKQVWLLQYDEGDHTVHGKEALDYTIRLTQFFDYYLKGVLPPKWMTDGVPATLKGIETGYELDRTGKSP